MPSPCPNRYGRFRIIVAAAVVVVSGFFAAPGSSADEVATPTRKRWTTSRVKGSPDPAPPFKVVRAFPNLQFQRPLLMTRCPGSDRLFVGEETGILYSFRNRPDAKADVFFDLRREIQTVHMLPQAKEVELVYGLAFHPDFENNRQCFVCYTLRGKEPGQRNLKDGTRVSRFTVTKTDPPRIDPASEEIVIAFMQGGHNGGDLHFGMDGMLYISTGDGASPNPPDDLNTGQDISDLLSSVLRIDVDRRDAGKNYAVPKDNPFVGMNDARPEVWAYGFRNPWRMSFDRRTGELFVGDVGWELWEMVHRIEKGGNYGWAAMEGPQPIKTEQVGPTAIHPALIELPHTIACSVTGGYVYRGKKFPELHGAYVFGDWETRRLWAARFEGNQVKEMPEITRPSVRISAFGEDADGELYFLDHDHGTVHTLERNEAGVANADFPTKLSETGLFSSVEDHQPVDGVIRFLINSRQWQDGATAEHWAAFPETSSATLHATAKPIPGLVYWHNFRMHFPQDAVLTRTLSLGGRRLETQILHYDGVDWRAYTYAWRDDQMDADLVPAEGAEREVSDGEQKRIWQYHSRSQCMSCHSNQSEYALAFLPEQLNRPGHDGRNQLVALTEAGYIRRAANDGQLLPPFDAASAAKEPKVANPTDESQPLEARARGYLHANCGHCHSEHGGGSVPLRLQFSTPVARMQAVGIRPIRGDFGLPDAAIIKSGDPYASTLYFRMAKFGRDRMPHIGAELPDEAGLKLIEQWISSLNGHANQIGSRLENAPWQQALASATSAMPLARKLGRGELSPGDRDAVLSAAGKLPPGPVHDLFEGYLPASAKGERKLGSNPRPSAILALEGDGSRGEKLFWSEALHCGKCHRVGARGTAIGPDLSTVGKLRSTEYLLESLLAPSRRVEPKYAAYLVNTADGRALTGLLVKRDESSVVLGDAEGKELHLPAENVETLRPLLTSLMPDGQLADLTAQEAADLVAYLGRQTSESSQSSGQQLVKKRTGRVRVEGHCLVDDDGPFLGLGVSYFTALWRCKNDRPRLEADLAFLSRQGFNYFRMLSMVGHHPGWQGREIAPVAFKNREGKPVAAWSDYWEQLRELVDLAYDKYGLRTQITIFADAQLMPDKRARIEHMRTLLAEVVAGREHKVILVEVANEAWQNGFPGDEGVADLREFAKYLTDRTKVPVAITSNHDWPELGSAKGLEQVYAGSSADIATWHFTRDRRTDDGWKPVYDCWDFGDKPGLPPVSSNEPIGPGSSVNKETEPIRLVMAAAFAYAAKLPMYVFHSEAGVFGKSRFADMPGIDRYQHMLRLLPPDLPNWRRNDGKEDDAPCTAFAAGQPNRYWPEIEGAKDGCVRNTGSRKDDRFVCVPIGIRSGGLELEARQAMQFTVYNPLTGEAVKQATMRKGERMKLPAEPGGLLILGTITAKSADAEDAD